MHWTPRLTLARTRVAFSHMSTRRCLCEGCVSYSCIGPAATHRTIVASVVLPVVLPVLPAVLPVRTMQ